MARCPFTCGDCCTAHWRGIACFEQLAAISPLDASCPYQTNRGCRLSRRERPPECGTYLCDRAESALRSNPQEVRP